MVIRSIKDRMVSYFDLNVRDVVKEILDLNKAGEVVTMEDVRHICNIRARDILSDGESFGGSDFTEVAEFDDLPDDISDIVEGEYVRPLVHPEGPFPVDRLIKYIAEVRLSGGQIDIGEIIDLAIRR